MFHLKTENRSIREHKCLFGASTPASVMRQKRRFVGETFAALEKGRTVEIIGTSK